MSDPIRLHYAECMKDMIGSAGMPPEEFDALRPKMNAVCASVEALRKEGKLGFAELPYKTGFPKQIREAADRLAAGYTDFVVVGMGGSALGNRAIQKALRHPYWNLLSRERRGDHPRVFVLDTVDPATVAGLMEVIDVRRTLFNVISKSGETVETLADYFVLKEHLVAAVGEESCHEHIIVTTDEVSGYLREVVVRENLLSFVVPRNVGGRFSVLSPVGLASAAFAGIDTEKLLAGAADMDRRCSSPDLFKNPAAMYAVLQFFFYWRGRHLSVLMPYADALTGVAAWYRQLWAESLGKRLDRRGNEVHVGPTPVKALGAADQHSQLQLYREGPEDKIVTFLSVEDHGADLAVSAADHYLGGSSLGGLLKAEEEATRASLVRAGRPSMTISLPRLDEHTLGQLFYLFELAAVYAGELFDIDAFSQPGVELVKEYTYGLLGRPGYDERKRELDAVRSAAGRCVV